MLILTRTTGEKIIIGEHLVTITVLEINDKSVRLGIDAPKELSVHREEIFNRIASAEDKEGNK